MRHFNRLNKRLGDTDQLSKGNVPCGTYPGDCQVSDPQMQNTNVPSNSLQNPMSRGFFINTQFHGNVTFNFCSSESKKMSQNVQHNSALSVAAARSPRDSREQCSQSPIRPYYKRIRMFTDSESD